MNKNAAIVIIALFVLCVAVGLTVHGVPLPEPVMATFGW